MLQEIRCRINQPLFLRYAQQQESLVAETVTMAHMQHLVSRITQGSLYAWEEEFRRGYLTLPGGHRVGLVGKGVLEHGQIRTLKQISGLNFRIARAVPGVANPLISQIYNDGNVLNCLIVSPPGCGKTTMLRDAVRQLSNGVSSMGLKGMHVAVVDERSELAGSVAGIPQLDVGCRTDVLDGCPKSEGLRMLIRSMAPQIVAVDEIGTGEDVQALEEAAQSGVAVIATAHGQSIETLQQHPVLQSMITQKYFPLLVFLKWHNGKTLLQIERL